MRVYLSFYLFLFKFLTLIFFIGFVFLHIGAFCVFCFNLQPKITIDYTNGESHLNSESLNYNKNEQSNNLKNHYVVNTKTKKIHTTDCRYANSDNTKTTDSTIEELESLGYTKCKVCNPK